MAEYDWLLTTLIHTEKLPPYTGQILLACAVLQDASAPVQFERVRSGDKDQGEPTVS